MRGAKRTSSANGNNGSKWINKTRRLAIYLRDGFHCLLCGDDLHGASPHNITLDHVKCRSHKTGQCDHRSSNLITACRRCNSRRQARTMVEYVLSYWGTNKQGVRQVILIRNHTRRKMDKYLKLARSIRAEQKETT